MLNKSKSLQRDSCDAELLVDRDMERESDHVDLDSDEAMRYENDVPIGDDVRPQESTVGPVGESQSQSGQDAQTARDSGSDDALDSRPLSEATDAGEQTLIDGVARLHPENGWNRLRTRLCVVVMLPRTMV